MKAVLLLVLVFWMQFSFADERARKKLSDALVAGSPWNFSNKHVNEVQQWRFSAEGNLETMSSYAPGIWLIERFTDADTIVHPSRAGGNTITYSLDEAGNVLATHSKNPSTFKSMSPK